MMKNKILSVILAASLSAAVAAAGTGGAGAASDQQAVLRIEIDPDTFTDVAKMCCYIVDETDGAAVVDWGTNNGVMTQSGASAVWTYDLGAHGVVLEPSHSYGVVFSDSRRTRTEALTISGYDSEREYTAVFSEVYTWESSSHSPVYKYMWRGEFDDQAGVDILRVCADDDAFRADSPLYCGIFDETAGSYALWSGRMTGDGDTWRFDCGAHGIALESGHAYSVTFNNAEPLTIGAYDRERAYTAVFTGAFIADEIGNVRARLRWTDEQPEEPFRYTLRSSLVLRELRDGEERTVTVQAADDAEVWLSTGEQEEFADSAALSVTVTDSAGKQAAHLSKTQENNDDLTEGLLFLAKAGEAYTLRIKTVGIEKLYLHFSDIFEYELGMECANSGGESDYYRFTPDRDGALSAVVTELRPIEDGASPVFLIAASPDFSEATALPCDVKSGETYFLKAVFPDCSGSYHFALDGEAPVLSGDANGDGRVEIDDATTVQRHLAEFITLTGSDLTAADANADGQVTIADVTAIQRVLAEWVEVG